MPNARHIAPGMTAVTPHLIVAGAAAAIDWYKKAFGAEEETRLAAPDGKLLHGRIRIGGAAIMLVDEMPHCNALGPKTLKGSPVTVHLYVPDADAFVATAARAGATVTAPVQEMFWGDRYGVVTDPFGHQWSVATHVRDLTPAEIEEGMKSFFKQMAVTA